jgi:uncharacterized protein DUF397
MGTAPRPTDWRTSSFSSNGSDCVEVFRDLMAIRDSKNAHGSVLRGDVRALLATFKTDQTKA